MALIGLVVNPVAGMGGAVGLKGTDGKAAEAAERGALPHAARYAARTLALLKGTPLRFLTCGGEMGESSFTIAGAGRYEVVCRCPGRSSAHDTKEACRIFLGHGADLILFCGGDGTARDVFDAVGRRVAILGIPAGVKMYSAVFAVSPEAAAGVVLAGRAGALRDAEILDVDEEAYRSGELRTRLYGYATVPAAPDLVQQPKRVFEEGDEERAKDAIAAFIAEAMIPGVVYILGPGTTTAAIARRLGFEKTLLGVDLVLDGRLIDADADEETIKKRLRAHPDARVVVSPLGLQGFILGRGNQQISADREHNRRRDTPETGRDPGAPYRHRGTGC
jgi:predicted polyphosphate/ATP-dependent NAD kinase